MSRQKIKGFTLMELMVAVAIVGIVVGIAVPSFQSIMAGSRVTSAANLIVSAVTTARSEAMRVHRPVTITEKSPASGIEVKEGANLVQEYAYKNNVTTIFQTISFRSNGLRSGAGDIAIKVCDDQISGKGKIVTVSLSGSTSVDDYTGACS